MLAFLKGGLVASLPGEFNFQIRCEDGGIHRYERIIRLAYAARLSGISDRHGDTITCETLAGHFF